MRRSSALFVLLMGCGRLLGFDDYSSGDADVVVDASVDTSSDTSADASADASDANVPDAPIATAFLQVALGAQHTCALTETDVWCWGSNEFGQLGSGAIGGQADRPTRVALDPAGFGSPAQLVAGDNQSCLVASTGAVTCWGDGRQGELGEFVFAPTVTPTLLEGISVTSLAIGEQSMCAVLRDSESCSAGVECWGRNGSARLGRGTLVDERMDPACISGAATFGTISGREQHYCGLNAAKPFCWGKNDLRQIQNDPDGIEPVPVEAISETPPTDIRQIAAGRGFTCALNDASQVRCWGGGGAGQLGDGEGAMRGAYPASPIVFPALEDGIEEIATGYAHACALSGAGEVYCWGQYMNGRIGVGNIDAFQLVPAELTMLPPAQTIVLGVAHACAITTSDRLFCWGENSEGRIGNGSMGDEWAPVEIVVPTSR